MLGNGIILSDHPAGKINSKIRSLIYLNDSTFLAGGADGIVEISETGQKSFISDLDVNKMILDDEVIYIAANTGLFKSDLSGNYKIIELPENNVKTVALDKLGNIWIGTNSSGVFVLKKEGGIFPFVLDRTDSKSKTILGIICDQSGDMWISTMNGVYQILLKEEGENDFSINHFGKAEGLITLECNQNALFEDNDNFIWVGTSEGLVRINPSMNDDLFRFRKPEMIITGVRLFMEDFDYSAFDNLIDDETGVPQSITLPYNKNHLTFDFIGINLKDPQGVKYEYRLLGAEEFWSPLTSDNYATYSFISHGEYDFEVRAINASGNWSEISRMHIIILPPFWLTWWFIMLIIAGGIIILILIFRARIKVITQKQENERLEFKNRLLFLEQQSLNASMNRHFIFNSLNSIQYFINSSNKLAANKYLTSFAKLIRKNLDSSQANNFIVTLKEELERIELYLSLEKMRFEGKFDYVTDIDDDIETDAIEIPSMILQPFVENSIIHGVLPVERKGLIQLKIYMEFDFLVFEVIDDGIGIDESLALKKNRKTDDNHESMGMEITNRRIDLLRKLTGENLMIIGPFQINNEECKSLGTKVIIKIFVPKSDIE
ncbi:MAG: histidine kinase [Crocinitomicaceae bacterium]|nr:histidine kinase [Crocinitomicaceae bacterium]